MSGECCPPILICPANQDVVSRPHTTNPSPALTDTSALMLLQVPTSSLQAFFCRAAASKLSAFLAG